MSTSARCSALGAARRSVCHVLVVILLPALLLGCDSFGAGSSGISLTANKSSISPSDSTVTLTLRNESVSPIQADFICGLGLDRKIDGTWMNGGVVNRICIFTDRVATQGETHTAGTSSGKLTITPIPFIAPGSSVEEKVRFYPDQRDVTAIRFRLSIAYRKDALIGRNPIGMHTSSNSLEPVGDITSFPYDSRFTSGGELVSNEIPVRP